MRTTVHLEPDKPYGSNEVRIFLDRFAPAAEYIVIRSHSKAAYYPERIGMIIC